MVTLQSRILPLAPNTIPILMSRFPNPSSHVWTHTGHISREFMGWLFPPFSTMRIFFEEKSENRFKSGRVLMSLIGSQGQGCVYVFDRPRL